MMNKNMLKQAQQMQARLAAVQDEIAVARTEATAGGGVVKVTVIGGSSIESIEIDPEVVDPEDVETQAGVAVGVQAHVSWRR